MLFHIRQKELPANVAYQTRFP